MYEPLRKVPDAVNLAIRKSAILSSIEDFGRYTKELSSSFGITEEQIRSVTAYVKINADKSIKKHSLSITQQDFIMLYGSILDENKLEIGRVREISHEKLRKEVISLYPESSDGLISAIYDYDGLLSGSKIAKNKAKDLILPKISNISTGASANYDNPIKRAWNGEQESFIADSIRRNPSIAQGNALVLTGIHPIKVIEMYERAGIPANQIFAIERDHRAKSIFLEEARKLAEQGKYINFYFGTLERTVSADGKAPVFENVLGQQVRPESFSLFDLDFTGFWNENKLAIIANSASHWSDPRGAAVMINLQAKKESRRDFTRFSEFQKNTREILNAIDSGLPKQLEREPSAREETILHWAQYFRLYSGKPTEKIQSMFDSMSNMPLRKKVERFVDYSRNLFTSRWPYLPDSYTCRLPSTHALKYWNQLAFQLSAVATEYGLQAGNISALEKITYKSPVK